MNKPFIINGKSIVWLVDKNKSILLGTKNPTLLSDKKLDITSVIEEKWGIICEKEDLEFIHKCESCKNSTYIVNLDFDKEDREFIQSKSGGKFLNKKQILSEYKIFFDQEEMLNSLDHVLKSIN